MEPSDIQFVGAPCGQHGPYTFYKAFKYSKGGKQRILALGEFFFVKILEGVPICLGELQLLWEDKNQEDQLLTSVRLYFLPEDTPEGRQEYHGEDEVLAENDKVVLRLQDLVSWLAEEEDAVTWTHGSKAFGTELQDSTRDLSQYSEMVDAFTANNCGIQLKDVKEEKKLIGLENHHHSPVQILSYPSYCRHKTMLSRLQGCKNSWLANALVCALGGGVVTRGDALILFCRDTIQHPDLEEHEFRQDHLAPNLKGRRRKRKMAFKKEWSMDSDSMSNDSLDSSDGGRTPLSLHVHSKLAKLHKSEYSVAPRVHIPRAPANEAEFLARLYKFMKKYHKPITRLPTLGFKEGKVDLYFFFTYAQKLGGYEVVTQKRLWKHIYDQLGGNPSNTSAATCTRRHYEKLLLPFERHLNGEDDKPLPTPYRKPTRPKNGDMDSAHTEPADTYVPKRAILGLKKKFDPRLAAREMQWERMRRQKCWSKDQAKPVCATVKKEVLPEHSPLKDQDHVSARPVDALKTETKDVKPLTETKHEPVKAETPGVSRATHPAVPPAPSSVQGAASPNKASQLPPGSIAMLPVMQGPVIMQGGTIMSPVFLQNLPGGLSFMQNSEGGMPYFLPALPQQVPNSSAAGPMPFIVNAVTTPVSKPSNSTPSPANAQPVTDKPKTEPSHNNVENSNSAKSQKRKSGSKSQRPSVIKHTRNASKDILNPAPVPRPYMPKAVYGPPDSGFGAPPPSRLVTSNSSNNGHFSPPRAHSHPRHIPNPLRVPDAGQHLTQAKTRGAFVDTVTSVLGVSKCTSRGQQFMADQQHLKATTVPRNLLPRQAVVPTAPKNDHPTDLSVKPATANLTPERVGNHQQLPVEKQHLNAVRPTALNLSDSLAKAALPADLRLPVAAPSTAVVPSLPTELQPFPAVPQKLVGEPIVIQPAAVVSPKPPSVSPSPGHSKNLALQPTSAKLPVQPPPDQSASIHPAFPQSKVHSSVVPQGAVPLNPFPQIQPQFIYQAQVQSTAGNPRVLAATPLYSAPGTQPFVPIPSHVYPQWYTPPTK